MFRFLSEFWNRYATGFLFICVLALGAHIAYFQYFKQVLPETEKKEGISPFAVGLPHPDSISFCGEMAPLTDLDVLERLERELYVNTYWQSNTALVFKRAGKCFPIIEKILAEENIPLDFKYLAVIESNLINDVSPAGAVGIWQIMPATGKELGLIINAEIDERYDLEKSTRTACKYLRTAYQKFGSWTMAAASYNMGMGGLNFEKTRQFESSYYDLYLNPETTRYIFRVLALKEIMEHPEKYHYNIPKNTVYQPVEMEQIQIDTTCKHLPFLAEQLGVSFKTLRYYNPFLRKYHLTIKGSSYTIQLPKDRNKARTPELEIPYDSLLEADSLSELGEDSLLLTEL